jgi:DNA repair protein RAD50
LAGEREVKAQTRLRFRTPGNIPVVATRVMQLTQGAQGKQTVKTLDSSLQTVNPATKEKVAQTRRCADIDLEVPELMGVSKAILQNVIFCHQEESNWPLEDSSTLKKKFDEIFAATRYTKALEELKKQSKQAREEQKMKELELKTISAVKENAQRLRQELQEAKEKLESTAQSMLLFANSAIFLDFNECETQVSMTSKHGSRSSPSAGPRYKKK